MVSRFVAEARAANQIRHRNIIDIFSFGKLPDGRQYYVMEYLDGEPLDALNRSQSASCRSRGAADPARDREGTRRRARQGHRASRSQGGEHFSRPDSDGQLFPKLLDFGIAKLMGREEALKHKTRTGVADRHAVLHVSPEQCRGKDVDHRTDVYAFGVLVYRMLTGAYPFDGDDYMAILMQQITADPPPPSTHLPECRRRSTTSCNGCSRRSRASGPLICAPRFMPSSKRRPMAGSTSDAIRRGTSTARRCKAYQTQPPRRTNVVATPGRHGADDGASDAKKSRAPLIGGIAAAVVVIAGIGVFAMGGKNEKKPPPDRRAGACCDACCSASHAGCLRPRRPAGPDVGNHHRRGRPRRHRSSRRRQSRRRGAGPRSARSRHDARRPHVSRRRLSTCVEVGRPRRGQAARRRR